MHIRVNFDGGHSVSVQDRLPVLGRDSNEVVTEVLYINKSHSD